MSFSNSSSTSRNLVFAYDSGNVKSYVGPPIQNKLTTLSVGGTGTSTHYNSYAESEQHYIPGVGDRTVLINRIQNNYTPSGNCCPSLFNYGTGIPVSGSTLYTYGILYKTTSGYTHPNFMYRYEYNSSGGYLIEGGFHDTGRRTHLGDGWYWAWNTFTSQPTAATFNCSLFYYNYSTAFDKVYVAKVLLAPGDYSGLHPKYWPEVNTTRTSAQVSKDLTGTHTSTASTLTYASDGTPSFNGSSNIITFANNTALDTQTPTVEVWVKTNATTQSGFWFEKGVVNSQYALFQEGSVIQWRLGPLGDLSTNTATYMNTTNWYHVVATYISGDKRLYINGTLVNSNTSTGTLGTNNGGVSIGAYGGDTGAHSYYYNGSIAMVKVYNRVLSAAEILQNFKAQRGRFGV